MDLDVKIFQMKNFATKLGNTIKWDASGRVEFARALKILLVRDVINQRKNLLPPKLTMASLVKAVCACDGGEQKTNVS